MNINGMELEFNVYKVSNTKKLEENMIRLKEGEEEGKALLTSGKLYDGINTMYNVYKNFFVDLLGVDVVGECDDVLEAQKMVVDFIAGVKPKKVESASNV